jgi:glyoxylase-like metal-dependent hydrolase (beta-lactamase superfamily II)
LPRTAGPRRFLIDDDVLIDAGTGVGDLTLEEMRGIDHVLLTHSHLDHVAALPLMIDAWRGAAQACADPCAGGHHRGAQGAHFQQRDLARFQPHPDAPGPFHQFS